jgi:hypothetical protein
MIHSFDNGWITNLSNREKLSGEIWHFLEFDFWTVVETPKVLKTIGVYYGKSVKIQKLLPPVTPFA